MSSYTSFLTVNQQTHKLISCSKKLNKAVLKRSPPPGLYSHLVYSSNDLIKSIDFIVTLFITVLI